MPMLLYNLALLAALVLGLPYWLLRLASTPRYREGLGERLGRVPARLALAEDTRPVLWVHAVSVGEVLAVSGLIAELRARGRWRVVVSTTTRTGQAVARQRFGEGVFYFPLDAGWAVRRYFRALRPAMLVLAETEFWPNVLAACAALKIPVLVANARVSDRSFPRYLRLRRFWRPLLSRIRLALAQTEEDARRLVAIGLLAERVQVAGNLKFDLGEAQASPYAAALEKLLGGRPLLVAGSTMEGEEAMLLASWSRVLEQVPDAVLLLAPRHPERFDRVAALVSAGGWRLRRRSSDPGSPAGAGEVILLDSMGELAGVYRAAALAFVGGSLVGAGGHNPLEPARFAVPTLIGPHYENFRGVVEIMLRAEGLRVVNAAALAAEIAGLLGDPAAARSLGERGRGVFEQQAGATARTVEAIEALLGEKGA